MAKKSAKKKTIRPEDLKTNIPRAIQYEALKGMSYRPSVRDENRRERKDAKQEINKQNW